MWESPIYKVRQPLGPDDDDNQVFKEVVIDVTRSAPSFKRPQKALSRTLDLALESAEIGGDDIVLDFGAGKLRNTLYLLEKGFRVCGVEYAGLFERSEQAQKNLTLAKEKYGERFTTLVYPHEFSETDSVYKLVLLINVINVMPIPAERLLVLTQCRGKLVPDGQLLWYTQRGDSTYRDRLVPQFAIGDGHYIGRKAKYKTFYREYTVAEIDGLLTQAGFEYLDHIDATWRNQARVYRRLPEAPPISDVLTPGYIDHGEVVDDDIPDPRSVEPEEVASTLEAPPGNPDPDELKLEELLISALADKERGIEHSRAYQEQVKAMFEHLFSDELGAFSSRTNATTGYVDIIAKRRDRDQGFFTSVWRDYEINCSHVVIESRNLRHSLTNKEFAELGASLGKGTGLGSFGILAYRSGNRDTVLRRCRTLFRTTGKAILPLDDDDFVRMLEWAKTGAAHEINRHLADRLSDVIRPGQVFISYSRKDRKFLLELTEMISPLVRRGIVSVWDDRMIEPGQRWREMIQGAIEGVEAAVLLVSASFQASDFIQNEELTPLLEAAREDRVALFPVMISAVDLDEPLEALQFVHDIAKPLKPQSPAARAEVWADLSKQIRRELGTRATGGVSAGRA